MALTKLQQRFVEELLCDPNLNATQAYIRAGYKARGHGAEVSASRLLSNAEVKAAIDAALAKRSKRAEITQDEVLQGLYRIAFADIRKLYHPDGRLKLPHEWDDDTADAVLSVEAEDETPIEKRGKITARTTKVRLCDKLKARELLGRNVGLFRDEPTKQPDVNVNLRIGDTPFDPSKLNNDQLRQLQSLLGLASVHRPAGPEASG